MSFSFSFSGDDIEDDINETETDTITTPELIAAKLKNTNLTASTLLPPKRHTLAELLESLPSQISYNYLEIPIDDVNGAQRSTNGDSGKTSSNVQIPRRSLFDIRQQLMAESDPFNANDETGNLLVGLETGDLRSGIYEGGFKTWECAVDLAAFVSRHTKEDKRLHVIELGAGSAVPSLMLLSQTLKQRREKADDYRKVRFTLCDYNEDVLRLGTAVNIFLVTTLALSDNVVDGGKEDEGEIEVDEESVQATLSLLQNANIEIDFISGTWGEEFVELTSGTSDNDGEDSNHLLVLASETIYSPDSLQVFSQTVLDLMHSTDQPKQAYIAAKKVYFGVGGGVQEFEEVLGRLGGQSSTAFDVKSAGVGRVILEVSTS